MFFCLFVVVGFFCCCFLPLHTLQSIPTHLFVCCFFLFVCFFLLLFFFLNYFECLCFFIYIYIFFFFFFFALSVQKSVSRDFGTKL